jgi:aspartate/methionine/tyrosine aminotransferase
MYSFSSGKGSFMSAYTLPEFTLERWFAEFEFVPGIRNLAASCPFPATTQELLELEDAETTARYLRLGLDYVESPGNERLRQGIANLYTTLQPENVHVTSGASESLFLLILTTVRPGDNIIVEDPTYGNIAGVAQSQGAEVRRLPLHLEQNWKPNIEQLAQLVDHKTRLIYMTHSHHPTGSVLTVEEMQAIARIAERVGAIFVSDEVFRLIALDGTPAPSVIDVINHAVVIGDMTKPWGLGGLRVGWVASRDPEILKRVSAARDYSTMCGSAPGEFLAEVTLRHTQQVMAPRLAVARSNRQRLADAIASSQKPIRWLPPQAGYTALLQLPFSTEPFCRYLAEEKRFLLLPGYVYGKAYERFMRIGFGCSGERFTEGLEAMMQVLQDWNGN